MNQFCKRETNHLQWITHYWTWRKKLLRICSKTHYRRTITSCMLPAFCKIKLWYTQTKIMHALQTYKFNQVGAINQIQRRQTVHSCRVGFWEKGSIWKLHQWVFLEFKELEVREEGNHRDTFYSSILDRTYH